MFGVEPVMMPKEAPIVRNITAKVRRKTIVLAIFYIVPSPVCEDLRLLHIEEVKSHAEIAIMINGM